MLRYSMRGFCTKIERITGVSVDCLRSKIDVATTQRVISFTSGWAQTENSIDLELPIHVSFDSESVTLHYNNARTKFYLFSCGDK